MALGRSVDRRDRIDASAVYGLAGVKHFYKYTMVKHLISLILGRIYMEILPGCTSGVLNG
jgi:hypothetical protein